MLGQVKGNGYCIMERRQVSDSNPILKNDPLLYSLEDKSEDDLALNAAEKTPALQEL